MEVRMIVFLLIVIILILLLGPPGVLVLVVMPVLFFIGIGLEKIGINAEYALMGLFVIVALIGHRLEGNPRKVELEERRRRYKLEARLAREAKAAKEAEVTEPETT
jgi:membrane protein implicated in regulation of membrane protease activity